MGSARLLTPCNGTLRVISGGSVVITHCPGVISVMSGGCSYDPTVSWGDLGIVRSVQL